MSLINLNLLKLRAQARAKSGVNVADYSNALLDDQLNIGYSQLAMLLANLDEDYFEEQNVKFDLVANSGLYSLPTDCIAVKRAWLAYSGTPISPSAYVVATAYDSSEIYDIAADQENVPTSNPIYDLVGTYVRYKPKPTIAVVNGGRLDYIAMPSALVNTADIPVIPVAYHDKIADYGAMQMSFKYEKWNKHTRLQNSWDRTMAELQDRLAERDRSRPVRFKSPFEMGGRTSASRRRELD